MATLLICFALASFAQQGPSNSPITGQQTLPAPPPPKILIPRSHEERERQYQAEHRIVLNLFVSDASGKPVAGLNQGDFTLLDNGQPRTLTSFREMKGSQGTAPVRVMLMLDAVNNSPRDIAADRKGIEQFLKRSPPSLVYPTSIALLSGSGATIGRPSQDRDALIGELRAVAGHAHIFDCPDGGSDAGQDSPPTTSGARDLSGLVIAPQADRTGSCLNLRFTLSVSALNRLATEQEDAPGRVILIWFGRGWPLLRQHEFLPDTTAIKQNLFDNLVEVTNVLRTAQLTLDAVFSPDLFRTIELRSDHDNTFFDGVPNENEVTASSLGLQVLAHQSGGLVLTESKDLAGEIAKCVADAESYYTLSFDSSPATGPGEFHAIHAEVNRPGLTVRTNKAYYAQP
jgi:VWFA-related protein